MNAVNDDATPPGMLPPRPGLPAELHEPFSTWCDTHHLEQLVVPGFRRVRRFSLVRSEAAEPPRYLTIYDLDRLGVLESDEYDAYRARSAGLPEFLQGHLRAARTDAWLVASVPARAGLVPGGAGLAHLFVPEGADLADWFAEHGVALLEITGGTTARLLHAAGGEQVVVVELPEAPEGPDAPDPAALPRPDALDDGVGWGLYRLDFTATPDS
jgi:hypothetical protein